MRRLPEIEAVYKEADSYFEDLITNARESSDFARAEAIRAKQIINDQAYFVLCWGQLESEINEVCKEAIRERINSGNWDVNKAWHFCDSAGRRLSGLRFQDRVTLVLDRREGQESPWRLVMQYYEVRNQIAHGALRSDGIDVTEAVQNFYVIQSHCRPKSQSPAE